MKRRSFTKALGLTATSLSISTLASPNTGLNILLITADDLGYEAMHTLNPDVPADLTPNINRFAANGLQFMHGHTNSPICQPSRATIATGCYGNTSGMLGFIHMKKKMPSVMQALKNEGYMTGVLGKVGHSTPDMNYQWDFSVDSGELGAGRDPNRYYTESKRFFERVKTKNTPFYMMINSDDPHRPFYNPARPAPRKNITPPSKLFTPDDVAIPPSLPDLPEIRKELNWYYNSIRRLDDTFGKVIQALDESGLRDNTLIMFLSDNGAAIPFAKANVYLSSTRTPWLVQWPGVIKPGSVDRNHFVSAVDFFPTVMDAAELPIPAPQPDGRSFLPLLKGGKQEGRDVVFKQIDYLIAGPARPMRSVQDEKYAYIYNIWSGPGTTYRNNNEGRTMAAMEANPESAERVRMFRHRDVVEFYDLKKDPGCLQNLAENPEYADRIAAYRNRLRQWMENTGDLILEEFDQQAGGKQRLKFLKNDYPSKESLMPQQQIEKIKAREQKKNRNKK